MKVLIMIPAFNEQDSIERVVTQLQTEFPQYDYIVINDCSTDRTGAILAEHGWRHLNLPINLGIGGGVQTGYRFALENGYDIAVQMDGDGQHDPSYIEKLIAPIVNGQADMTVGSRFIEKIGFQTSFMRRVGIRWLSGIIRLCTGLKISDVTSGFRGAGRDMIRYFSVNYAKDYPEPEAIVAACRNGYRICEVPVVMHEREGGQSSIRAFKSIYYMIKVTLALLVSAMSVGKKGAN